MAKKKAGKKSGKKKAAEKNDTKTTPGPKKTAKRTRKSRKGGFGVFTVQTQALDDVTVGLFKDEMILTRVAENLKDTAAGTAWIKENAETYEGQELAIVQIKKTVKVRLTQTTKVTLE